MQIAKGAGNSVAAVAGLTMEATAAKYPELKPALEKFGKNGG